MGYLNVYYTAKCVGLTYRVINLSVKHSKFNSRGNKTKLTITDNLGKAKIYQFYMASCIE